MFNEQIFFLCIKIFLKVFLNFSLRSPRSISPQRQLSGTVLRSRNVSPSFADSTFSAVHAALNKRQVQVKSNEFCFLFKKKRILFQIHDLETKLTSSRETIQQLKEQLNHSDADRRHFEQQATTYKLQIDELRRQFDDTAHERDRSKTALESSHQERTNMEKIRIVSLNKLLFHHHQIVVDFTIKL